MRYLLELYNERRLDLAPELLGDPQTRHAPGETKVLNLTDNVARLQHLFDLCPVMRFDPKVVVANGDLVSVCWDGTTTQANGKSYQFAATETFRVIDGRIVEIWNAKEARGYWGSPTVS